MRGGAVAAACLLGCGVATALGQVVVPGADGSDGALHITANTTIDLSQAVSAAWDTPSPQPAKGVYDGSTWAVVFKYSSVTVDAGRTLTFANHPSHAPVVWLVNGDVTINGAVRLSGADGGSSFNNAGVVRAQPGPGGFFGSTRRNNGVQGSGGFGPGGGINGTTAQYDNGSTGAGSHASVGGGNGPRANSPAYGNTFAMPLIGGSGGARYDGFQPFDDMTSGGGGGGAILIAATGTITVNGAINADGGTGGLYRVGLGDGRCWGGAGGAIRLIAANVAGTNSTTISAVGGANAGGNGRIRIESSNLGIPLARISPAPSVASTPATAALWPGGTAPGVRLLSVCGRAVTDDPRGALDAVHADLVISPLGNVLVRVETRNSLLGLPTVRVRVVPLFGTDTWVDATLVSGDAALATWVASVPLPAAGQVCELYATAQAGTSPAVPSRECSVYRNPCPADINLDGGVTIDDLLAFLGCMDAGADCADVDDGNNTGCGDGGVTIDDLLFFLTRVSGGC